MEVAGATIKSAKGAVRSLLKRYMPALARRYTAMHLLPDRQVLEETILPGFRDDPAVRRLLFVGCEWYSKPYERVFRNEDYWTLEIDPAKRWYGSRRHIVDALRNLGDHTESESFDAILCNGVFMKTAIETREEAEPSFAACLRALRPRGWFVLGWNDTDELRPYPPSESEALAKFERAEFPPLGVDEYRTKTPYRHTYTFYRKPA